MILGQQHAKPVDGLSGFVRFFSDRYGAPGR